MRPHVQQVLPVIVEAMMDKSSWELPEVAVRTLGLLVTSTGMVEEPLRWHPEILGLLLRMVAGGSTTPPSLRREVLRTLGTLGAVDAFAMRQLAPETVSGGGAADLRGGTGGVSGSQGSDGGDPSSQERRYPKIALSVLMEMLGDSLLSMQDTAQVLEATMLIARVLRSHGFSPFLPRVVPAMVDLIWKTHRPKVVELVFGYLGQMVHISSRYIITSGCVPIILETAAAHLHTAGMSVQADAVSIDQTLLEKLLVLIESLALQVSRGRGDDEVVEHTTPSLRAGGTAYLMRLPDVVPLLLDVLVQDRERPARPATPEVLRVLQVMSRHLGDYRQLLVPALSRLIESTDISSEHRRAAITTAEILVEDLDMSSHASGLVHALVRLLVKSQRMPTEQRAAEQVAVMSTLCSMAWSMGSGYAVFVPTVGKVLDAAKVVRLRSQYDQIVHALLRSSPLPAPPRFNAAQKKVARGNDSTRHINHASGSAFDPVKLKRAWEVGQRATPDDWMEWLRKFSVELLHLSPSPVLHCCYPLAVVYQPLARKLFNAAFVAAWERLDEAYQDHLIRSLETAFRSTSVPSDVLHSLLDLAEFMERDEHQLHLHLDIQNLGNVAMRSRAFAKALHYKELEFQTSPQTAVEALISINNQLRQPV